MSFSLRKYRQKHEKMVCSPHEGDPPLEAEECIWLPCACPPEMLFREHKTSSTGREKDSGLVALLQTPSGCTEISATLEKGSRSSTPCCDNNSLNCTNSLVDCNGQCKCSSILTIDSCRQIKNVKLPSDNVNCCNLKTESRRIRRKSLNQRNINKYLRKLSEVFVWLCFLGFTQPPCSRAAPLARNSPAALRSMDKLSGPALWINPCGVDGNDDVMPPGTEIPYLSNRDLLNQIIVQAGNALAEAESFKGDYVKKTFKADFKDHHNSWKHSHYDWLPGKKEIPKDLGEEVSMAHLQSIENNLNITLANSYEYLQRFAVGLEQVVSDQRAHSGPFKDHFIKSEFRLRAVLCEIQVAILEHNAERRPDITRAIMDDQYRNGDDSSRNLRDWIIYRDYMNALEYIIEVFKFITSKMSP